MPNALVRDVPEDVHAALQRKAERRHQSLQQYLSAELRNLATRRQISDVLEDIETRHGGQVGLGQAVDDFDEDGHTARGALRAAVEFTAPDLIDVETVEVLRKRCLAHTISDRRFAAAVDDLQDLNFERVPTGHMIRRAYELRANVTSYDATYVALAEALDCELITGDQRPAAATGPRCASRALP